MKSFIVGACAATSLLLSGGSAIQGRAAAETQAAIHSARTGLSAEACTSEIDVTDPNETPFLLCPGVGDYALIVRRVEAGRRSIDVVDPTKQVLPLRYEEFVTRQMSTLGGEAEWRVLTTDGKPVPLALIVRVEAREDIDDPEKVTGSYLAVAKITPAETCVTDAIPDGTMSRDEVLRAADSAPQRPCAPPRD
jgi:hypothetical protein